MHDADPALRTRRRPGQFRLEIDGGISAFRAPRPAVVMVSTAAVERNAIIGEDEAARKADIPIVQLNPGGALPLLLRSSLLVLCWGGCSAVMAAPCFDCGRMAVQWQAS